MSSRRASAAAAKGKAASKRRARDESSDELEEAELRRRSRGPPPRDAGAAAGAVAAAAAPAPPAAVAAVPGTAAIQALLRFFTVRGRATQSQVERLFAEIQDRCTHADSKTLQLDAALHGINSQIRFMELEIKRHRSEMDDDVWLCLVDNTERVAAANAENAALAASQEAAEAGGAAAAASSSSKKQLDAGAMAKLHNPTLFSEREIPFFKALLDGLLECPAGLLPLSDALDLRLTFGGGGGAAARKLQLSGAEASYAVSRFEEHGWLRSVPPPMARLASSASKLKGKARTQYIALGERVYAELKGYVERKTDGRLCSECNKACVLGVVCYQQSSDSKAIADASPARACPGRLHFACARARFQEQGKHTCPIPDCAKEWDLYFKASNANAIAAAAAAAVAPGARLDERKEADRRDDDE